MHFFAFALVAIALFAFTTTPAQATIQTDMGQDQAITQMHNTGPPTVMETLAVLNASNAPPQGVTVGASWMPDIAVNTDATTISDSAATCFVLNSANSRASTVNGKNAKIAWGSISTNEIVGANTTMANLTPTAMMGSSETILLGSSTVRAGPTSSVNGIDSGFGGELAYGHNAGESLSATALLLS